MPRQIVLDANWALALALGFCVGAPLVKLVSNSCIRYVGHIPMVLVGFLAKGYRAKEPKLQASLEHELGGAFLARVVGN